MKKDLLIILMLFGFTLAQAQLSLSVKQGVLFTDATYTLNDGSVPTYYPEIGGFYKFGHFAINSGLGVKTLGTYDNGLKTQTNYQLINGVETSVTTQENVKTKYLFSYLTIPVYASLIYDPRDFYIGLDLGLEANINVSAINETSSHPNEKIPYVNTFDPNLLLGAKIGTKISRELSLDLTLRYTAGIFSDVTQDGKFGRLDATSLMLGLNYNY